VVDLGDGQIALLAQVAEHVRLALQMRLFGSIDLGYQRRAVFEFDLVDLADAATTQRTRALQPLAQGDLDVAGN
jgi:hypothetical protein